MSKIYLVVQGYYSDWDILGYFTNKDEAEKWCILKSEEYYEPYVLTVNCLDGKDDVSDVHPLYSHKVMFKYNNGSWNMMNEPDRYSVYSGDVQSNYIDCGGWWNWIKVIVNQDRFDRKKAEKLPKICYISTLICAKQPKTHSKNLIGYLLRHKEQEKPRERQKR